jgi:hypothetical protein
MDSGMCARDLFKGQGSRTLVMLPGLDLLRPAGAGSPSSGGFSDARPGREVFGDLAPLCHIHAQVSADEILAARAMYPEAVVGANALCLPEVRAMADFSGDADALCGWVKGSEAKEFIIFCEAGLSDTMAGLFPDKVFRETETEMFCPNMKLTNIKDVLRALESLAEGELPEAGEVAAMAAGRGGGASPAGGRL